MIIPGSKDCMFFTRRTNGDSIHARGIRIMIKTIETFIQEKGIAVVGASRDRGKWGNMVVRTLKKKGYTVYPVNPNADEIDGGKCFHSVQDLPPDVGSAILTIPKGTALQVVNSLNGTGIKRVWFHDGAGGAGASSHEAIDLCNKNNIDAVYGVCPMMFFPKPGIHKLHLWLKKIGGKLPKELAETL